jgi:hypothetical protein
MPWIHVAAIGPLLCTIFCVLLLLRRLAGERRTEPIAA